VIDGQSKLTVISKAPYSIRLSGDIRLAARWLKLNNGYYGGGGPFR